MMIHSHAHAREYVTHACMMAHILEHVYGRQPIHEQKVAGCPGDICLATTVVKRRKPRRGDFANGALNH